ncbi:MAG: TAXI family TRAP transporter solute-binding subunit [Acetobacteraceae bacterium]|jgi:TRAP-type uncharacterized transport system substrate-binding protein
MLSKTLRAAPLHVRLTICCSFIIVLVVGVMWSRPPTHVTIEAGPAGGSFYQIAQQYRQILAKHGIDLQVRPKANSLEILPDLANPASGIDIGFEAQDASAYANAGIYAIGEVQLQPLFVFASADLGRRIGLTDLRGRKIVMPPADSATSDAAVRVLQLYDITPDNTSFTFMQLADAANELRAGHFDAGIFMLAPENQVVRDLASWSGVRLVSIGEAKAIANHLPSLRPIVLARGIYDVGDGIPPSDVAMLAGTVDVAVRRGLHPYVIYMLLEAMAQVHRGPTLVTSAGVYPSIAAVDLPVHALAREYYRSGLPWVYGNLPPPLAAFVDRYLLIALALFVLVELYQASQYLAELGSAALTWPRSRRC